MMGVRGGVSEHEYSLNVSCEWVRVSVRCE